MLFLQLTTNIKNCEGCEILPYLQVNELTCHNFMDADRRPETARSESKDFFTHGIAHNMNNSIFLSGLPDPNSQGKTT